MWIGPLAKKQGLFTIGLFSWAQRKHFLREEKKFTIFLGLGVVFFFAAAFKGLIKTRIMFQLEVRHRRTQDKIENKLAWYFLVLSLVQIFGGLNWMLLIDIVVSTFRENPQPAHLPA